MKKNILVFPCGSEIGLEIHRSLSFSTHVNLYGGSSADDHGKFVYKNYIGNVPFYSDEDFVEKINAIVDQHNIDFIFPAHDDVVLRLAQEKTLGTIKCGVITSSAATCEITRSKLKTYKAFDGIIPTPKVYESEDVSDADLPVFLKPESGSGSKGVHLAKTLDEVRFYTDQDPSLIVLEYLPHKEYTIDCFTDKNKKLLFVSGRQRRRISGGISVNSFKVDDERFRGLAEKINQNLDLRGAWFFQVKEKADGELVLMEIAARIAGTMGLERARGVNLPLLSLFDAMGMDVDVFENDYNLEIDRALHNVYAHNLDYKHVYLDFDDLVIFEEKVNPSMMAFVYQCINKNIKVHLLTRHREVLEDTLKKYRLQNIFDELILVREDEHKHSFIKEKDAIFVDDSFAERKSVHDNLGIAVFDAHMVEALIEKL